MEEKPKAGTPEYIKALEKAIKSTDVSTLYAHTDEFRVYKGSLFPRDSERGEQGENTR